MGAKLDRIACVAIVKNEERHIAEWLAYQFALGFDTVLLLDNLSTDATIANARSLASTRDVRVVDWPLRGEDYQLKAYQFAVAHLEGKYEWIAFFDTDEFLVLDPGLTLKGCLSARHDSAAIVIPWAIFGSSGHRSIPEGLVIENFVNRGPASFWPNRHVKSIIRPAKMLSVQSVHSFVVDGRTTFLDGRDAAWQFDGILNETPDYNIGKLHHYFTRSREHWTRKLQRGYPNAERKLEEFEIYDLNDIFDDSAARLAPEVKTILAQAAGHDTDFPKVKNFMMPFEKTDTQHLRLGIAITTFNRRALVVDLVGKIISLTKNHYDLVVCDDGSTDGTVDALRTMGVRVIGGINRGIAWNKNRGIYYLLNVSKCDVVLLLDDDVTPAVAGWESEWIEAACRYGHANYALPAFQSLVVSGSLSADDPGLATAIPGCALVFSSLALSQIGYFDIRFGRYGHEHSDFSFRAMRAGYGGIIVENAGGSNTFFYVISGGLTMVPSLTTGTQEDLDRNGRLLGELGREPIYRNAWLRDDLMDIFLGEIEHGNSDVKLHKIRNNHYESLTSYQKSNKKTSLNH